MLNLPKRSQTCPKQPHTYVETEAKPALTYLKPAQAIVNNNMFCNLYMRAALFTRGQLVMFALLNKMLH